MKKKILLAICFCLITSMAHAALWRKDTKKTTKPQPQPAVSNSCRLYSKCCNKQTKECANLINKKNEKDYQKRMQKCQQIWNKQKECFKREEQKKQENARRDANRKARQTKRKRERKTKK
jgi:hypothetical protein